MSFLLLPRGAPCESGGSGWLHTHQSLHALHVGGADGQGFFVPPPGFVDVSPQLGNLATHVQDVVGHREEVGSFLGAGRGFCRLPDADVHLSWGKRAEAVAFPVHCPSEALRTAATLVGDMTFPPGESGRGPSGICRAQSQPGPHPEWKRLQTDSPSHPL